MIKRRKLVTQQDSIRQGSLTAQKGIDISKAPIQPDTVQDVVNFDVDDDGGLILRKPLLLANTGADDVMFSFYAYDGTRVQILTARTTNNLGTYTPIVFNDGKDKGYPVDDTSPKLPNARTGDNVTISENAPKKYRYDIEGTVVYKKYFNTPTSTILYTSDGMYKLVKLTSLTTSHQPYTVWGLFKHVPEKNIIEPDAEFPFNPNMLLDNPNKVDSREDEPVFTVAGLLAYVPAIMSKDYANVILDGTVSSLADSAYIAHTQDSDNYKALFNRDGVWSWGDDINTYLGNVPVPITKYMSPIPSAGEINNDYMFGFYHTGEKVYYLPYEQNTDGSYEWKTYKDIYCTYNTFVWHASVNSENPMRFERVDSNYVAVSLNVDTPVQKNSVFCLKLFLNGKPPANTCVVWEYTTDGVTYHSITADILSKLRSENVTTPFYMEYVELFTFQNIKRPKTILSEYDGSELTASDILDKGITVEYDDVVAAVPNSTRDILDATVLYVNGIKCYNATSGSLISTGVDWIRCTFRASVYTVKTKDVDGKPVLYTGKLLGSRTWAALDNTIEVSVKTDSKNVTDGYNYIEPIDIVGSESEVLYHNSTIYNFGKGLKNVIYPSDTGSFITPLYNQIDLSASEDSTVNALIPWRNCLIAMTDTAVYRIVKADTGYTTAAVSTFTGIPARDARTAKAILNGIIFKSHEKVYTLYPNTYSEDENILRLSEISTPVAEYVTDSETDTSFAIATPSEYLLFTRFGGEERTQCLRYAYSTRVWSRYIFNVALIDYNVRSVTDIRLFGTDYKHEYYFDKLVEEVVDVSTLTSPELYDNITYGDWLTTVVNFDNVQAVLNGTVEPPVTPFEFTVDSGQKSDAMGIVKQFIETKATYTAQSDNADFPTELSLYIDGDEHPLQLEEATDAAVQRGNQNSLVLGTEVHTASASLKDTTVRYFAKHSGKGKSIRYVLKGKSVSRFKLYEIAYRYRLPRSKQ